METGQYIRRLAEFVTGKIELAEFKQFVEERLFELRQSPEMTAEKRALSGIELYLHEAEEGIREISEVYAHVQSILDKIIVPVLTSGAVTVFFASAPPPKIPYLLSKTFDIDCKSSDKQQTITTDLPLVASK